MRGLGISNLVATIMLIAIAIALVVAISAFVFGLLGNTARYGNDWPYLYESLYNNYTLLERNFTLLLRQYNELKSKYVALLSELNTSQGPQCSGVIVNISENYWGGGYVGSSNSIGLVSGSGSNNETHGLGSTGYLMVYPNYFVYNISNLTTYFIVVTIHNGFNESVALLNASLYIDGADPTYSSIMLGVNYPANSTDDIIITFFPGTDLGYVTSLSNYFDPLTLYFNNTLPINVTSIGLFISYKYGNDISTINYTLDIGGNFNNT